MQVSLSFIRAFNFLIFKRLATILTLVMGFSSHVCILLLASLDLKFSLTLKFKVTFEILFFEVI